MQASPTRIANHLEQSGKQLQAVAWRVKAAQEATRVYAHHQALEQYQQALENNPPLRTAFQVRVERINLLQTLDDPTTLNNELESLNQLVLHIGDPDVLVQAQLNNGSKQPTKARWLRCPWVNSCKPTRDSSMGLTLRSPQIGAVNS
jgi:hypothetical protein